MCVIPIITYFYFASTLASKETLTRHNDTGIELLDQENRLFFTFYQAKHKHEITLLEITDISQQAVIAMEDKDFYSHPGFSVPAIFRSFFENIQGRSIKYGGSTITQQLVKNSLLNPRKDFLRKYQEIVLAQEIERRYSKKEILEMYLNTVYFGEGAFGIQEAAHIYFNKKAADLTLGQSAILAGILPAPSKYSLLNGNLDEAKKRQELVLNRMVSLGYISSVQKDLALAEDLEISPNVSDINSFGAHFAIMVRDELIKRYGEEAASRSGFKVKTTLNLDWQKYAESEVAKQVLNLKGNNVSNGAAVVIDPKTSEVRALVGSKDWYDDKFGKFNIALSLRPPGSAFKPIVYLKAFEKNLITTATILRDEPTAFANFDEEKFFSSFPSRAAAAAALASDPNAFYKPVNYDRKFRGPVTARRALSNSLNVPAVSVMKKVGVEGALDSARNLGLSTLGDSSNYGLSLVLGAGEVSLLEMTNAYSTFAAGGKRGEPVLISEIRDKMDNVVFKHEPDQKQVTDAKYAFLISSILSDNTARAEVFGTALNISRPAAVKTGTTEDYKDAWTIGYTPSLSVGVWVGNNQNEPMDGIAGSLGAAPIWRSLMEKFLGGTPVESFEPPVGVVKVSACGLDLNSKQASGSAVVDYFVKGTEPSCKALPLPSVSLRPQISPSPVPAVIPRQKPQNSSEEGKKKEKD